jgi:endoglucanase
MNFLLLKKLTSKPIIPLVLILALTLVGLFLFSEKISYEKILGNLWTEYKNQYVDKTTGRTIDEQREGVTTSEGQSYTMLRSVWSDDRETFDKSWKWTKDNLSRKGDYLFTWLWGKNLDGSFGIITNQNGQNSAIDGDIDIAYALILGSKKWNNPQYLVESKLIINDIWDKAVIQSNTGKLILASNDIEKSFNKSKVLVNPSYFSTYAFREFANYFPDYEWNRLADDSYFILNKIQDTRFGDFQNTFLPPDWVEINPSNMSISTSQNRNSYGYDAVRIPWRVALDYKINKNQNALNYLKRLDFLGKEYQNKGKIYTVYNVDGSVNGNYESLLAYSTALSYFDIVESNKSNSIIQTKIIPKLSDKLSYYDSNWVWFGLAFHYGLI